MARSLLILLILFTGKHAVAAEFSGYVAVMTDYVKRGVTQSEGDPALQLGGDVSFTNGLYLGAWASTMDVSNGPTRQRDREVNYYAGYIFDVTKFWRISVNAVAYEYPGQTGNVDYSYQEYSVGGSYNDQLWLDFSYSPDLYNTGHSSTNVELFAEWPLSGVWAIGGGAGYYDTSNLTGSAYQYWQLGITGSFKWVDVDLRFHDTDKWVPIISTPDRAKSRVVLKIQVPF
jgi:uncharacterized protein (TIGR02001 family)